LRAVLARIGVIAGEQVFEDLAEQFGIKRYFFVQRGVLVDGEFVAVEQIDQPLDG
jgi:hypothetical protein